jgi:hypothetical protein
MRPPHPRLQPQPSLEPQASISIPGDAPQDALGVVAPVGDNVAGWTVSGGVAETVEAVGVQPATVRVQIPAAPANFEPVKGMDFLTEDWQKKIFDDAKRVWPQYGVRFSQEHPTNGDLVERAVRTYPHGTETNLVLLYFRQLPGCCGVGLLHDLWEYIPFYEKAMPDLVDKVARKGYARVMFTSTKIQTGIVKGLKKAGFENLHEFKNARTKNDVTVWFKDTYDIARESLPAWQR